MDSLATFEASIVGSTSLGGITRVKASNGVFIFDDFSITAQPLTNDSFLITTDGITDDPDVGADSVIGINVEMRDCQSGEIRSGSESVPQEIQ